MKKPIVFFDLETTGVDTSKDRIVEIAMIKTLDGVQIDSLHRVVNPLIPIPKGASDVHGITDEDVCHEPCFKEIADLVVNFLHFNDGLNDVLCDIGGFNSNRFDIPLLSRELDESNKSLNFDSARFIDVGVIFKRENERTLSAAVKEYLGENHEDAHTALADTKATFDVFQQMLKKHPHLLGLSMDELSSFCNFDKERADLDGKFYILDGEYYFSFGKYRGQLASSQIQYLYWMIKGDFSSSTKAVCNKVIKDGQS
jgi:DNA polymerase-3 subunit epsilon